MNISDAIRIAHAAANEKHHRAEVPCETCVDAVDRAIGALEDAGWMLAPQMCEDCGRFLSLNCSVHGQIEDPS